jgi:hypothetical protein
MRGKLMEELQRFFELLLGELGHHPWSLPPPPLGMCMSMAGAAVVAWPVRGHGWVCLGGKMIWGAREERDAVRETKFLFSLTR